jgi:hypothetical protein
MKTETYSNYLIEQGKLRDQYDSLSDSGKVQGLDKFLSDSQNLRQKFRDSLPNPMAQKMFDSESLGFMARNVFNAGGVAGEANKRWQVNTNKALFEVNKQQALKDPWDDAQFKEATDNITTAIQHQIDIGFLDAGPIADTEKLRRTSELWSSRIEGMARQSPFQAKAVMLDAIEHGYLRGEDVRKVGNIVDTQLDQTGSRGIVSDIYSGHNVGYGAERLTMPLWKVAISTIESGGRYDNVTDSKTKLGRALGKYQVMEGELQGQLKEAGLPSMTPEAFLKDHAAQEKVFESAFGKLIDKYGNFNDAASAWFTGRPFSQAYQQGAHDINIGVAEYLARANAVLAKNMPIDNRLDKGEELAERLDPGNQRLKDYVRDGITRRQAEEQRIKHDQEVDNVNLVQQGINGYLNGKKPASMEDLKTTDPRVGPAMDWLEENSPGKIKQFENALTQNAKGDVVFTPERKARFESLLGMASRQTKEFSGIDLTKEDLPFDKRIQLEKLQNRHYDQAQADPKVTRAIGIISRAFPSVMPLLQKNDEPTNQFYGALQSALEDWQADHEKPPTEKEVQDIGRTLLMKHSGAHWYSSDTQVFSEDVPDEYTTALKKLYPSMTADDVRRQYVRSRYQEEYQKLYGKAPSE